MQWCALCGLSPPPTHDLTSLLTGHVGHDGGTQGADGAAKATTARDMDAAAAATAIHIDGRRVANTTTDDGVKQSPPKKKTKKSKTAKEKAEKASKQDRSGTALITSTLNPPTPAAQPPASKYKFERVFYEARLELKGEDKYSAYVKHIGNLIKNIQLVDPLAIMHAIDETGDVKLLGSKTKMSTHI